MISLALLLPARVDAGETILYDRSEDALILRFAFLPGELASSSSLSLELWGSGIVRVRRPAWAQNPGDHEVQLSQPEVQSFLAAVVSEALVGFDANEVRAAKAADEQAKWEAAEAAGEEAVLHFSSDAETTRLSLDLIQYDSGEGESSAVALSLRWLGLRHDSRHHSAVPALVALAEADAAVRLLLVRSDLGG